MATVAVLTVATPAFAGGSHGEALVGGGGHVGGLAEVGEAMSFGAFVSLADDDRRVVVRSVELVEADGLAVVGTVVQDLRLGGGIGAVVGFPPPGYDRTRLPMPGAVIDRGPGAAIVFGVRRDEPGRGDAHGFSVIYSADGVLYRQTFPMTISVCAIPGYVRADAGRRSCPTP